MSLYDDIDLSSVFASFQSLQASPHAPDIYGALPGAGELSGLFFGDGDSPNDISNLHSAAQNEFADTGYSQYSFLRDQPITYNGRETFDVQAIRKDFPIFNQKINGKDLIWFDNAATTQKPQQVIDAIKHYYEHDNSNIHRAAHTLAARSTDQYEGAREKVKDFIHAASSEEILFVRGTTEGINLVAQTYGRKFIYPGDEIIVSTLDHHANIVPWQQLAKEKNAHLLVIPVNDKGEVILEEYERLLSSRTKIVSFGQVNNTFGTISPAKTMIDMAKRYGARVLIDGAQSIAHTAVDVQDSDVDFFVFSGHKIYAPNGIGVVYGKKELLELIPPWQSGGNMIKDVTFEETVFNVPPHKFEAGTPNVADAIGLGAALDYVSRTGIHNIEKYEHYLTEYARKELGQIDGIRIIGNPRERISVVSFVIPGIPTPEVGKMLDLEGIALRAGHHCAQPALRRMGVEATVRPSFAFYNTTEEIDRLVVAVNNILRTTFS
ncbi:MAG: cysteine desulfurase [Dysgonamonadaceae bacterium]|jgi:cysteine desulfurase/selenocysteine lyase|nr:cysteine desulfurase [Dysgonamonadaceae bacterium]